MVFLAYFLVLYEPRWKTKEMGAYARFARRLRGENNDRTATAALLSAVYRNGKIAVIGGAVNGLYFYPKEVQDRAIELGLIDRNTMNRKRKCFMIPFFIVMLAALVLIIGLWNEASSFGEAYWQALLFLEVMNIYDGVVIDKLWVGHSQFWVLPGLEDAPFVQTWRQVLKSEVYWR